MYRFVTKETANIATNLSVWVRVRVSVCAWQWLIELEKAREYVYHGTVFGRKEIQLCKLS